ncbi:hypothetical protein SCHPADRAFT_894416 [Schizopora paradoxa]|uniref:BTB domain-containing protein n=1 Tax=Schizopora paradoxa TaxID=27342 RepID=A0A0H2R8N3_9AGAM|nr:hypothetical protein SCHPADRAFT_894416 [Schizopora paradoxa]
MTPPPKRARTGDTSSETIAMEVEDLSKLKQHEKLWFEDGNIVLATDVHLYCVHRGILALNSTVFKDMLELPNVGNTSKSAEDGITTGDSWEGKPLVRMVGDRDGDVYHILMAIYDVSFYCAHEPATLPVILSLIRMSTKYNFTFIQDKVTSHLKLVYPTDLESLEGRSYGRLFVDYNEEHDFQLLVVAEQCNMKAILPMLYLDCAASPMDDILKGSEAADPHNFRKFCVVTNGFQSTRISTGPMELFANYMKTPTEFLVHELLFGVEPDCDKTLRASICKDCKKASSEAFEKLRLEVWNAIPSLFELGTWEDYTRE